MRDFRDDLRYGFELYPFALTIAVGIFLSGTGPTLVQSLLSGMRGMTGFSAILVTVILLFQLAGAVVAAAGFFGALKRVLEDTS